MLSVKMMTQVALPLYIEVENGEVVAVWYDDEDGRDRLLSVGSEYFVSYRTIPKEVKQHMKEHEHDEPINWLKPKVYKGADEEEEGDEK